MPPTLPPEMWEAVFDRVKEPQDFLSVINSTEEWDSLMSYKKTVRLFPLVFKILLRTNPEVFGLQTMLSLRQVDNIWKEPVDTELEANPERYVGGNYRFTWSEPQNLERMAALSASLPSSVNPFLGRYMKMIMMPNADMYNILEKHGSNLKSFSLSCPGLVSPIQFGRALQFVPNLENLTFGTMFADEEGRNERDLLLAFLTAYGATLNTLHCVSQLFCLDGISQLVPNLVDLRLRDTATYELTERDARVMSQTGWRLKKLDISLHKQGQRATTAFLTALNSFSPTLESLEIRVRWAFVAGNFNPNQFHVFPRLKELKLEMIAPSASEPLMTAVAELLSLARAFPNLEKCKIIRLMPYDSIVSAHDNEMAENLRLNVMGIFPKLEHEYMIDVCGVSLVIVICMYANYCQ
ncbi:hypothetical protein Ocin01_10637 [Orchesella cincta]|uniref:F-box domain-containing protein n=1 Tax=Orchesella cincta TaxID=48709 RepID=A0A1D2MSM7_ORCCI|nr:hypothetical protein Ocin01_10637 [Orchesella cincta]